jgi:hypothetical protein
MDRLRRFVEMQIAEFRKTDGATTCAVCRIPLPEKHHIDHATHFAQLVYDFHQIHPRTTDDDYAYLAAWWNYHKEHAILRRTCIDCNLTRKKWKPGAPTCAICNQVEHLKDGVCAPCENRYL